MVRVKAFDAVGELSILDLKSMIFPRDLPTMSFDVENHITSCHVDQQYPRSHMAG